jgi:hypothetical protein
VAEPAAGQRRKRSLASRSQPPRGVASAFGLKQRLRSVQRPRPLMAALFCLLVGAVGWQVLAHGFAAYLARVAPHQATAFNNREPDALLRQADGLLALARQSGEAAGTGKRGDAAARPAQRSADGDKTVDDEIRALVVRALQVDPVNAHGLAMLAELSERSGDQATAMTLLEATVRASQHEGVALYKLAVASAEARNFVKAVGYLDTLIRTLPDSLEVVKPLMAALAEDQEGVGPLTAMLGRNPSWRGWFLSDLMTKVRDVRTPQTLFLGLKDTANPPSVDELGGYLNFLVHHGHHGIAYYTWLQFTPPEHFDNDNLLFNGRFERKPSGYLFDWRAAAGEGVTAEFITEPDAAGGRGLNVEFGAGRVQFRGVSQVTMLSPGRYTISGKYKGRLVGRRGLLWRINCEHAAGKALGETPMAIGSYPDWQSFNFDFAVPADGCAGQVLRLTLDARSASEQILQGGLWYDNLRIVRRSED